MASFLRGRVADRWKLLRLYTCNALWMISLPLVVTQSSPSRAQMRSSADLALPRNSANLIVPILDLRYESMKECGTGRDYHCTTGPGFDHEAVRSKKVEKLVGRIIDSKGSAADRAVVVLLQYSVGASEAEDLLASITDRGKRVLPYLLQYRDLVPRIPDRSYPDSMLADRQFRQTAFDESIRAIKAAKNLRQD